jgi:hypothetical protein
VRKLGVLVASGITLGSMVLASPAVFANDGRRHDRDRHHRYERDDYRYDRYGYGYDRRGYGYGRYGYRHERRFNLGVRIIDHHADDRGRRGPSRGDRWSLEFHLVDYRSRVGNGFADCRVTKANGRSWRGTKSHCDVTFRLPDGELRMAGTIDGDDFDDGHATLPIRGGSGEFRGADGKTVFHSSSGYYRHDRGRARDLTAEVVLR